MREELKMNIERMMKAIMEKDKKPIAWGCKTCNKIDWADKEEQTAKPEHVCYRGTDIGVCVVVK